MVMNQQVTPGGRSIRGRKSWFFSDQRVLCLGSGISCDDARFPTQTTLCQKSLRNAEMPEIRPTTVDGTDLVSKTFPDERMLDSAQPHWFLDIQQTGYYVPAGQTLGIARRHQTSRDVNDWEDTEGDFLTAWLDHGPSPAKASYEYLLAVRATSESMRRIVAQPPYRVLQRDDTAHIVWDTDARRWGCVFFEPIADISHAVAKEALPVKAIDRPCLVMTQSPQNGRLDLSVADPDLNLQENGANAPRALQITLRGKWRLEEAKGTTCVWLLPDTSNKVRIVSSGNEETMLEIICEHGASYDVKLSHSP
jgi:chondroitin-sulfate-ABC endolyase/exolyase